MHRRPLPFVCQRRFWERRPPQLLKFSKAHAQKPMLPKGKYVAKAVPREIFEHNGYTHVWPGCELREEADFKIRFGKLLKNGRISKDSREFLVKEIIGLEEVRLYIPNGKYEEAGIVEGYIFFRNLRSEKSAADILAEYDSAVKGAEDRLSCRYEAELKERRKIEEMFKKSKCHVVGSLKCEDCIHQKKDGNPCSIELMASAKKDPDALHIVVPRIKNRLEKEKRLPDMVKEFLAQMHDWKEFKRALRSIKEGFYDVVRLLAGGNRDGRITDFNLMVINPDKNYHTIITNEKGKRVSARRFTYCVAGFDKLKELPAFILPVKTRANLLRKRKRSTRIYFTHATEDTAGW